MYVFSFHMYVSSKTAVLEQPFQSDRLRVTVLEQPSQSGCPSNCQSD